VLGGSLIISLMLVVPRMTIVSPGSGVQAGQDGTVTEVSDEAIVVAQVSPAGESLGDKRYALVPRPENLEDDGGGTLILPTKETWQEPNVEVGQEVNRKSLLARGQTRIFFQANLSVFAVLVIILGTVWGVGKAAVYKYIPDYFPEEVGVVGGMVGVLGGLGGFFCPIIFGYLLEASGLWTSSWMFVALLSLVCLVWMNMTIRRMAKKRAPEIAEAIEGAPRLSV
jgi:NNP family nitrate/nitrite transporter-like MFS transporter